MAEIVDKTQSEMASGNVSKTVSAVIEKIWEQFRQAKFNFEHDLCLAGEERGNLIVIIVGSIIGLIAILGFFLFLRNCTSFFDRVQIFRCCRKKRSGDHRQSSSESDDLFEI